MRHYSDICDAIKVKRTTSENVSYEYVLKEYEGHENASFEITLYEICVRLVKNGEVSFYKTGGLFSALGKAMAFLEYLYKHLATPQNLPYIIDDAFSF